MKTSKVLKLVLAVVVFALTGRDAGAIIDYVVFDNTGISQNHDTDGPYALGMDFTVGGSGITVTGVGAYDGGASGFLNSIPVAIFRVSDGTLVAGTSVTLSGSTWDFTDGSSRFMNIPPVTLVAGTYCVVAAGYGALGGEPYFYTHDGGVDSIPPVFHTYGGVLGLVTTGGRWEGGMSSLPSNLLTDLTGTTTDTAPNYAAGTFTVVPEASQFAIAGVGLLGLVYVGRCACQRRKVVA